MRGLSLQERIRRELPQLSIENARQLALVLQRIIDVLHPERIHVFGSVARGEATPDSDIDLLIVVSKAEQPTYRLAQAAYHAAAPHSLILDILVMPREEFDRRSKALASLPATVLREGRMLYAA